MSDFPEEEPDPEMAADDEENAPGLVELLEEIVENEEREELEGLAEPDVEFDLETGCYILDVMWNNTFCVWKNFRKVKYSKYNITPFLT